MYEKFLWSIYIKTDVSIFYPGLWKPWNFGGPAEVGGNLQGFQLPGFQVAVAGFGGVHGGGKVPVSQVRVGKVAVAEDNPGFQGKGFRYSGELYEFFY